MIATETVPFKNFVDYFPYAEDTDERLLFKNLAFAITEATSKWNILCCDMTDDLQCGVQKYKFDDLTNKGLFIEGVLAVSVNGICYERVNRPCTSMKYTYSVDHDNSEITIYPAPVSDCPDGLSVSVSLSVNINTICELPLYFFKKYAVPLVNYTIYKQAILRRGEDDPKSYSQFAQLRQDAVDYFLNNECNAGKYAEKSFSVDDSPQIGFSVC